MRLKTLIISLILLANLVTPAHAQQPDLHQAGLAVVHGDGSIVTACVDFSEESISGAELLRRSGLQVTLSSYGGLGYGVCAIGDEGCPARQDCFCQCRGSPCNYWVYSHRRSDGSWAIAGAGASSWQLHDGDVDGWVWGDGSAAPPAMAFEQICPPRGAQPAGPPAVSEPVPTTAAPPSLLTATPVPSAPAGAQGVDNTGPPASATVDERGINLLSYGVFGIVIVGLGGWLTVARYRRGHI